MTPDFVGLVGMIKSHYLNMCIGCLMCVAQPHLRLDALLRRGSPAQICTNCNLHNYPQKGPSLKHRYKPKPKAGCILLTPRLNRSCRKAAFHTHVKHVQELKFMSLESFNPRSPLDWVAVKELKLSYHPPIMENQMENEKETVGI